MIELPSFPPLTPEGTKHADQAVQFFGFLRQCEDPWYGKPLELLDWQRIYLRELFGRRDPATGLRRYRKAFIFIPRKNGKTTTAAGLVLKLTIADQERGAQCYGAAYDKDQAKFLFRIAKGMVEQDKDLSRLCSVNKHESLISVPSTRSYYKAIAHDPAGSWGSSPHGIVADEFHAWKTPDLYRALDTGTGARRQPLTIVITTAGIYDPESPCWQMYDYATKVRDGVIDDPTFLPVIFEAPKDADWQDPEVWAMANPSLGVTPTVEFLERVVREAKNRPSEVLAVRQLHLNQWPEQLEGWLPMDRWQMCGSLDMDEDALRGKEAWLGLDLASTRDLTAIAAVIPLEDGTVATPMRFFCPRSTVNERSRRDGVDYLRWMNEGWLKGAGDEATDYGAVRTEIHRLAERYDVREIAVDPWNALQLAGELEADGFTVIKIPQTMRYVSPAAKELERLVATGRLRHGNNPILTWCASNCVISTDGNENVKPDKKKSTEKIDGIDAVCNGLARSMVREGKSGGLLFTVGR